ncbi:MAG: efflux transporter outer membrane subunit [Betaproteobacteria bacterium]
MRAMNRAVLAVLATALLPACTVGPDYQRPALPLPASYTEAGHTAGGDALIDRSWWQAFKDPLLDQLIEQALRNNGDMQLAAARFEEAAALMREAGASRLPEIGLATGATRTSVSSDTATPLPAGYPVLRPDYTANLNTSFELDFWGRLRSADATARALALASSYGRATVELTIVAGVSQGYLSLRSLDAQIAVAGDTLATRGAALGIAESRHRLGAAGELELQQARTNRALIESQLTELRQQRAVAEHQLALLCATPGLAIAAGDLRQLPLPPLPPAGLPASLLEARPDIRQAEAQLIAANARIGVAKSALFPTISLTGSLGSESKELSGLFAAKAGIWSVGLLPTLALFDSGKREARLEQANAQQQQALAAYRQAVQAGFKEVRDALVAGHERGLAEQATATQVEATARGLELARKRHEAGYSAYLEVLDAQRAANDASLAHIRNRQLRLVAAVDLFKALGGGWRETRP